MGLLAFGIIVGFLVWYAMRGRDWLKEKPWAWSRRMFTIIEPIEIFLYKKSQTMLVGRLLWLGGLVVSAYDAVSVFAVGLDLTPLTSILLRDIPENMRGLVVSAGIGGIGLLVGWLRKRTSKPIEIVAAPTTPETIVAERRVETANAVAVAVADVAVAEAKAA